MMAIREGRWRCPRCTEENLGRQLACSSCGDTRDDEVAFYLPGDAPAVSDEELLARAAAGPERLCDYCDAASPAGAEVCVACGAPLGAQRRAVVEPVVPPPPVVAVARPALPSTEPKRRPGCWRWGCLAVLVALGLLLAGRLWQRDVAVEVRGVAWRRSVEAERLATVTRTGWEGELPSGARPLSRQRAVRSHRQVQTGTRTEVVREEERVQTGSEQVKVGVRDLGNGFFEDVYESRPVFETRTTTREVERPVYRDEPVYDVEVRYELDEWQLARTAEATGDDLAPRWPELESGERERAGSRREHYEVHLVGPGGKRFTHAVPEPLLARYPPGTRLLAKVDSFGAVRSLRPR